MLQPAPTEGHRPLRAIACRQHALTRTSSRNGVDAGRAAVPQAPDEHAMLWLRSRSELPQRPAASRHARGRESLVRAWTRALARDQHTSESAQPRHAQRGTTRSTAGDLELEPTRGRGQLGAVSVRRRAPIPRHRADAHRREDGRSSRHRATVSKYSERWAASARRAALTGRTVDGSRRDGPLPTHERTYE